ncbi:hypothetical protein AB1K70_03250 [Bremerella sp. JC770]|uniref:hypothetical protein n=1 Tax=Bremerella sp. JC770 TaxID=3232137 RepID=UPI0034597F69
MTHISSATTGTSANAQQVNNDDVTTLNRTSANDTTIIYFVEGEVTDSIDDSTDEFGLSRPGINIKDALLILGSAQTDITEEQLEFATEQLGTFSSDIVDLAAENLSKILEMRDAAEVAELMGDIGKYMGYAATGLTLVAGVVTLNPGLVVMGIAMISVSVMNEQGATEDIIDGLGGGVGGSIALGAIILTASVASGGTAGIAMFTTLAPGLIFSQENCKEMGMDAETAMIVSMSVCIGMALAGGLAMGFSSSSRVASQVNGTVASNSSGALSKGQAVLNAVGKARLEKLIQSSTSKLGTLAGAAPRVGGSVSTNALLKANRYTTAAQVVLDASQAAVLAVRADYNYQASIAKADADYLDAQVSYDNTMYGNWKSNMDQISADYQDRVGKTSDAIAMYHNATSGHVRSV